MGLHLRGSGRRRGQGDAARGWKGGGEVTGLLGVFLQFHHASAGGPLVAAPPWGHLPHVGDWIDLSPEVHTLDDRRGWVHRVVWLADRIVLICRDAPPNHTAPNEPPLHPNSAEGILADLRQLAARPDDGDPMRFRPRDARMILKLIPGETA